MCCDAPAPPDMSALAEGSTEVALIAQETAMEQLNFAKDKWGQQQEMLDRYPVIKNINILGQVGIRNVQVSLQEINACLLSIVFVLINGINLGAVTSGENYTSRNILAQQ